MAPSNGGRYEEVMTHFAGGSCAETLGHSAWIVRCRSSTQMSGQRLENPGRPLRADISYVRLEVLVTLRSRLDCILQGQDFDSSDLQ